MLAHGVTVSEFWEMSYDEMKAFEKGIKEKEQRELQQQALMDYNHASLIAIGFNNPKGFPKDVARAYPFLFERSKREADLKEHYNAMKKIQAYHNIKGR